MEKFFVKYGEPFMKVFPVEALKRNRMFREIEGSGGFFAVNMNTGALTIIREKQEEFKKTDDKYPAYRLYYMDRKKDIVLPLDENAIKAGFQLEEVKEPGSLYMSGELIMRKRCPDGYYENIEKHSVDKLQFYEVCGIVRSLCARYF